MLIFLFLIAAFNISSSTPILPSLDPLDPPLPFTAFSHEGVLQCINPARQRTMQDIVWSCLATIFACTWVAVHPNVPDPCDSKWTVLKQRIMIMIYAILCPEFVMMWALRQRIGAARHMEQYNQEFHETKGGPWTLTHGFLLEMRGLRKYKDGNFLGSVEEPGYRFLDPGGSGRQLNGYFDMTEEEINDKSKGDFVTKLLVVFQTTWFILQCLARLTNHLPVTNLEAVTLGFASLNIITYALWWNKPQNMHIAIPIHVHSQAIGPLCEGCSSLLEKKEEPEENVVSPTNGGFLSGAIRGIEQFRQQIVHACSKMPLLPRNWRFADFIRRLSFIGRPIQTFVSMFFGTSIFQMSPAFYASQFDSCKVCVPFCLIATGFGCLHLIPVWTSGSPYYLEKVLWQISTSVIIIQPVLMLGGRLLSINLSSRLCSALVRVVFIGGLGYVIAHVILIVLALTSLRNLPPGAYQSITWTTFIPHL
ncbi:hypothetical protein P691DRAFT_686558 [Macrolepiota fuliginosa MF-IS2]|uniref:Integral membrane protein n=1 Tax=Macrolepiota fuliginosa MF-IS2 TaxID=1400762 RepID=A0A9P5WXL8_9AGAR|nr:hypothetical protein P691DRAFT_686558 [Macrolepiota fuliginosa MF-IS2]